MYFADLLVDQSSRAEYESLLAKLSDLVTDSVGLLARAWKLSELASYPEHKLHHVTVQVLARHICEALDGVAALTAAGCAEPCKPLMRSAFEAMLGIQYILEKDEERRGLAYQVAHAHRKMKLYRRLDPSDNAGKELAKVLANDPVATGITKNLPPQFNMPNLVANFEGMLRKPEYAPLDAEWARMKRNKKTDPAWHSLFGGPADVRTLAIALNHAGMYEFLYRHWSNSVHAGDCFENLSPGPAGVVKIKPIRHPEGLQLVVSLAVSFVLAVSNALLKRYGKPEEIEQFRADYVANIQPRNQEVMKGELIKAPWR